MNQLKRISCSTSMSIKRWKVHLLFMFFRRFRHMYHIIMCSLDVTLLSSRLFLLPLCVPVIIAVGGCLSEERCAGEFYLSAFSMGTCACRWRAHVVNQWQREQSESARENRRTRRCCRSSVNTCPLPLNQVFEMYICAHMCCRTMTRSVDDVAETETGTRHEMKRKICLFSIGPELLTSILGYFLWYIDESIYNGMKKIVKLCEKKNNNSKEYALLNLFEIKKYFIPKFFKNTSKLTREISNFTNRY